MPRDPNRTKLMSKQRSTNEPLRSGTLVSVDESGQVRPASSPGDFHIGYWMKTRDGGADEGSVIIGTNVPVPSTSLETDEQVRERIRVKWKAKVPTESEAQVLRAAIQHADQVFGAVLEGAPDVTARLQSNEAKGGAWAIFDSMTVDSVHAVQTLLHAGKPVHFGVDPALGHSKKGTLHFNGQKIEVKDVKWESAPSNPLEDIRKAVTRIRGF